MQSLWCNCSLFFDTIKKHSRNINKIFRECLFIRSRNREQLHHNDCKCHYGTPVPQFRNLKKKHSRNILLIFRECSFIGSRIREQLHHNDCKCHYGTPVPQFRNLKKKHSRNILLIFRECSFIGSRIREQLHHNDCKSHCGTAAPKFLILKNHSRNILRYSENAFLLHQRLGNSCTTMTVKVIVAQLFPNSWF